MWLGVDVRYTVMETGMKEDIVLSGPSVTADFMFEVVGDVVRQDAQGRSRLIRR